MENEYQPYGLEWQVEMKKRSKDLLIGKIKELLIERSELRLQCELYEEYLNDLKARYNDLLFDNSD